MPFTRFHDDSGRGKDASSRSVKFYAPVLEGVIMKGISRAVGVTFMLASSSAALAHHSYAMFDLTRESTLSGTVKTVEWTNPHVWLFVASEGAAQEIATYAFETVSPGELIRFYGWNKSTLSVGDKITVRYAPLRSGQRGGAVRSITLADGRVLKTRVGSIPLGPPPGGPPGAAPPGIAPPTGSTSGAPPAGPPRSGGSSDAHR